MGNGKKDIRPTIRLTEEEHKKIAIFCVEKGWKVGDFLKNAALYCVEKKINIKEN